MNRRVGSKMLLDKAKSKCQKKQKEIVSRDKKATRMHKAFNKQGYNVRQYQLDGEVVKNQKCCDFLLINDSLKKAYFIELKGGNIDEAVPQLQAGERLCSPELKGYGFYYRIICSKVKTHNVEKNIFRKFKRSCGSRLKYNTNYMEETLS